MVLSSVIQPVAPIPSNDVQPADGSQPLVLDSLSYFSEVDGATLLPASVRITTPPAFGTAVIDPTTGNIAYTAYAGFSGTDTIGFTVGDTNGLTSQPAYVNEIVTQPIANPDTIGAETGVAVTIPVLANDASVAAPLNPASVTVTGGPSDGTASVNAMTGAITYTSTPAFSGTDSLSYTVRDANGVISNAATVTIVVNRPQANDEIASTQEGSAVVIPVLSKDSGPSALVPSSVTIVGTPADGTAAVSSTTGNITYTPDPGFTGTDSLTYTVGDVNHAVSKTSTITIAVQAPAVGTQINPAAATTETGVPVAIDVLAADSSPVGLNPATVTVATAPLNGTTSVDPATGVITYLPNAGFVGMDTFTYSVRDDSASPAGSAAVTVVVNSPRANDSFGVTAAGQSVVIPVLAGDADVDNSLVPSTVTILSGPTNGSVVVDPSTGNVTYTAGPTFSGIDSFTYTVANAIGVVSNPAKVSVLADRPTANDEFGTTDSGYPITIPTLASDTDPAGPSALVPGSVTILSGPSNGTASVDPATGNITYTSVLGFNGTDTLTYTVADTGKAVSNVGTISIVVNRPTAEPDSAITTQNTPVALDVAANDSDPDGNQYLNLSSVTITTRPANGTVAVSSSGIVTYTPSYNFAGTDTFAYTIADDHGAVSNPAIDTITVQAPPPGQLNPGPVLVFLPAQPAPPAPTGQTANMLFVEGLYRDILGRQADPIGLNTWVNALQSGVSKATVATDLLSSQEHLNAVVSSYYEQLLNRAPDPAGLAAWVKAMQAGVTEQTVVLTLLTSSEFLSLHNTPDAFVNALYTDLLGRNADAGGLAQSDDALDSGKMNDAQVAIAFISSREGQLAVVDAYYSAFLGHNPDPVSAAAWVAALEGNQVTLDTAAIDFLTSVEYAQALAAGIR